MFDVMAQDVVADDKRHLRQGLFELVETLFGRAPGRYDCGIAIRPHCSKVEDPDGLRIDLNVDR